VREIERRRVAAAKSRHASKEELRDAKQRIKEIEEELRQIALLPETKEGEERELRYARVLRLRGMRDDFQRQFPIEQPSRASNMLLALVMAVASFMLCAFCAGGGYLAVSLVNQKPDPVNTANAFWDSLESGNYSIARTSYFSPTLREQLPLDSFIAKAQKADKTFGAVSNYALVKQTGDFKQAGTLVYSITRGAKVKYTVTLQLMMFRNSWGVSDVGAALDPTQAGVKDPNANATPTDTPTDTATPTS
jgi:hypothetical protein